MRNRFGYWMQDHTDIARPNAGTKLTSGTF